MATTPSSGEASRSVPQADSFGTCISLNETGSPIADRRQGFQADVFTVETKGSGQFRAPQRRLIFADRQDFSST